MEKRFEEKVKNPKTGRTKTVKYGQAGKAADGGDRIRPFTKKADAYCARSAKIKGDWKDDPNVKERAPLSAGASVDHGVEVEATEYHVNRAADRGCSVSSCSFSSSSAEGRGA